MSPYGRLGETSWPGSRAPAGSLVPDRDRKPLRCRFFLSLAQGRHPDLSGPLALGDGSCLLTLKLLSFSQADDLPASRSLEDYCRLLGPRRVQPAPPPGALTSRGSFPFSRPGCDTVAIWRHLKFVLPRRDRVSPHWLAVTTYGL